MANEGSRTPLGSCTPPRERGRSQAQRGGRELVVQEHILMELESNSMVMFLMLMTMNYTDWALVMRVNLRARPVSGDQARVRQRARRHDSTIRDFLGGAARHGVSSDSERDGDGGMGHDQDQVDGLQLCPQGQRIEATIVVGGDHVQGWQVHGCLLHSPH